MVTGDRADAAETMAAALDLDTVLAGRSPSDKVDAVATERKLHPTVMVGDCINDAPALAAADVGIAMGARGATASSEAADVVILVGRLDRLAEAVRIARRTRRHRPAEHHRRYGSFGCRDDCRGGRLAHPCGRGAYPGGDRCARHTQCLARPFLRKGGRAATGAWLSPPTCYAMIRA